MPSIFIIYVKFIDKITDIIGRITMYTVFVMMGILVLSFVTRNIINFPLLWIIEMAQFIMTGYYLMGGAYSMKENQHVRMDLVYGNLSEKNKARMDLFTSVFLIFYLIVLLIGSYNSLVYTLETNKRLFTARAPTAEHSTRLAIPIINRPVITKKIAKGIIPALRSFNFSINGISLSSLGRVGPSSGCNLQRM